MTKTAESPQTGQRKSWISGNGKSAWHCKQKTITGVSWISRQEPSKPSTLGCKVVAKQQGVGDNAGKLAETKMNGRHVRQPVVDAAWSAISTRLTAIQSSCTIYSGLALPPRFKQGVYPGRSSP